MSGCERDPAAAGRVRRTDATAVTSRRLPRPAREEGGFTMTTRPATAFGDELRQADNPAALSHTGTQACWLCGIHMGAASMVPDGGPACADVHWYCADTVSCTQRWTKADGGRRSASGPPGNGHGEAPLPISGGAAPWPRRQRVRSASGPSFGIHQAADRCLGTGVLAGLAAQRDHGA